jgi:hypothetical protein
LYLKGDRGEPTRKPEECERLMTQHGWGWISAGRRCVHDRNRRKVKKPDSMIYPL